MAPGALARPFVGCAFDVSAALRSFRLSFGATPFSRDLRSGGCLSCWCFVVPRRARPCARLGCSLSVVRPSAHGRLLGCLSCLRVFGPPWRWLRLPRRGGASLALHWLVRLGASLVAALSLVAWLSLVRASRLPRFRWLLSLAGRRLLRPHARPLPRTVSASGSSLALLVFRALPSVFVFLVPGHAPPSAFL